MDLQLERLPAARRTQYDALGAGAPGQFAEAKGSKVRGWKSVLLQR